MQNFALHCVLCVSLFVTNTMAQEFPPADREHRQGMSFEEYSAHREKMRLRMQPSESQKPPVEHIDKPRAYGQGFQSRNRNEEGRQDAGRVDRPDRPRLERIDRGDRMRR